MKSGIKFKKIKTTSKNTEITEFRDVESSDHDKVIGSNLIGKVEKISLRKKTLKLDNSARPPVGNT